MLPFYEIAGGAGTLDTLPACILIVTMVTLLALVTSRVTLTVLDRGGGGCYFLTSLAETEDFNFKKNVEKQIKKICFLNRFLTRQTPASVHLSALPLH